MHPRTASGAAGPCRFPRRRGDAPHRPAVLRAGALFPPQARGCTVELLSLLAATRVSPAGAGMHRRWRESSHGYCGFPRRRGDAPSRGLLESLGRPFPPQARGCTSWPRWWRGCVAVSPAGAGMHPGPTTRASRSRRFPRRRGDAPRRPRPPGPARTFPPQARGCTPASQGLGGRLGVSPAGAGMHLPRGRRRERGCCFPRRRGDAPYRRAAAIDALRFPPQARGCTPETGRGVRSPEVSPAGAGMHPRAAGSTGARRCFPRRRGDAPRPAAVSRRSRSFPPQARGCTLHRQGQRTQRHVSPAGAGMHPTRATIPPVSSCFPRRRGDAPHTRARREQWWRFPPQARGCTEAHTEALPAPKVSPAGAGMHRVQPFGSRTGGRFPRRRGDAPRHRHHILVVAEFPPQARGCTVGRK